MADLEAHLAPYIHQVVCQSQPNGSTGFFVPGDTKMYDSMLSAVMALKEKQCSQPSPCSCRCLHSATRGSCTCAANGNSKE